MSFREPRATNNRLMFAGQRINMIARQLVGHVHLVVGDVTYRTLYKALRSHFRSTNKQNPFAIVHPRNVAVYMTHLDVLARVARHPRACAGLDLTLESLMSDRVFAALRRRTHHGDILDLVMSYTWEELKPFALESYSTAFLWLIMQIHRPADAELHDHVCSLRNYALTVLSEKLRGGCRERTPPPFYDAFVRRTVAELEELCKRAGKPTLPTLSTADWRVS